MSEHTPARRSGGEVERSSGRGGSRPAVRDSLMPMPAQGFGVTFAQIFRKVTTEQYPFEPKVTKPRYHGRHVLNRHPDGLEKCVGCELCAWACPADAIYVEGGDNTDEAGSRPVSGTARCTRSTTCAASSAGCASRPARPAR